MQNQQNQQYLYKQVNYVTIEMRNKKISDRDLQEKMKSQRRQGKVWKKNTSEKYFIQLKS